MPQDQLPDAQRSFKDDPRPHFGLPAFAVGEVDRNFGDVVAQTVGDVRHFDLKNVAVGTDAIQPHAVEGFAAPDTVAAGGVADGDAEQDADVDAVGEPAQELAIETP